MPDISGIFAVRVDCTLTTAGAVFLIRGAKVPLAGNWRCAKVTIRGGQVRDGGRRISANLLDSNVRAREDRERKS